MANIRVLCPHCDKELEIGAEFEGQDVECGECYRVFVARPRAPAWRRTTAARDEPVRPREAFDDYDYEPRPGRTPDESEAGGASGAAVAGLILGVIALLSSCCPFTGIGFGVLAIILGALGKNRPSGSGAATAAIALGILAFLISTGVLVFWFALGR